MNKQVANDGVQEQSLVKLYTEITGATEACARGVFMYLSPDGEEESQAAGGSTIQES